MGGGDISPAARQSFIFNVPSHLYQTRARAHLPPGTYRASYLLSSRVPLQDIHSNIKHMPSTVNFTLTIPTALFLPLSPALTITDSCLVETQRFLEDSSCRLIVQNRLVSFLVPFYSAKTRRETAINTAIPCLDNLPLRLCVSECVVWLFSLIVVLEGGIRQDGWTRRGANGK